MGTNLESIPCRDEVSHKWVVYPNSLLVPKHAWDASRIHILNATDEFGFWELRPIRNAEYSSCFSFDCQAGSLFPAQSTNIRVQFKACENRSEDWILRMGYDGETDTTVVIRLTGSIIASPFFTEYIIHNIYPFCV